MEQEKIKTTFSILEPGLWQLDPVQERYRVPACGVIVIELHADDELVVHDPEGGQLAEVVPFTPEGKGDPSLLGITKSRPADGMRKILAGESDSARRVRQGLENRGLDLASAKAATLFVPDSSAREEISFLVTSRATCAIAAPGNLMNVEGETLPPTDLLVFVKRASAMEEAEIELPEPLADARLDFRIDACTAQAYEVKAGEFIQVIDVMGRECSDFQAFDRRKLDDGIERGLDVTTTRTLMGYGYPGPGLFSKYYDVDMQPLVEVIRDTVGRHDTFGLACSAKYYEDMGYFGHANCSDNFNTALKPFEIASRKGWAAANFFFNTGIDDHNVLYSDEPWSRPGDYVLLQAQTDLVCVSSACPDDTSPANAWKPTDIHVRIYPEKNKFTKAITTRMTPDSDAKLTQETAFHPRTSALTRNFTEYRGYWLPTCYRNNGAVDEYYACRERAIVTDLSPLRKFEILGPDAEALMQWTLTRNVRKLAVGQVVYSSMCYPHGGMMDDGTLLRLCQDNFRWIGGDDYGGVWLREQANKLGLKVWVKSSTDQIHNIAVQGPKSREILKEVVWTPPTQPKLEEIGWFRFTIGRIGDLNGIPIMVSRTGYTGELGYEVWCHPNDAPEVWDAIWEAGQPHGMLPLGLDALDLLRIESGLVFAGYEFSDETDPFESGVGFTVPLKTKEDDFVGREVLINRKANPQRKLVGLELEGNEPAAHGDCVHVGRGQVGVITSGMRSPILRKNIALCRIDVTSSEVGTEVQVGKLDGHQKRIPAMVVPFPFYDPEKLKPRS
ncbi:MAG: Aminomethyltransferase [Deltaproteobacteria bacterium]|jgi:aminomethyltransferase|nr:Aminomethyltransferase [Deltaproteobacteria bacterium]